MSYIPVAHVTVIQLRCHCTMSTASNVLCPTFILSCCILRVPENLLPLQLRPLVLVLLVTNNIY